MADLIVYPATGPLSGSVPVPSDKSIGHRALLLASLATGRSSIRGFSRGEDNVATANAMRALGVSVEETSATGLTVTGRGLFELHAPADMLDCGNSGTTMRLLAGLLCAQPFASTLGGDASLSRRPMMRVVGPLRMRGARIEGNSDARPGDLTAPLRIAKPPAPLAALEYESPVASAQVKSALLLSGLYAHGATWLKEPTVSRDHTERLLSALGAPIRTLGSVVMLDPAGWDGTLAPLDLEIPGDLSAASFLLVAANLVPGSRVTTRRVGLNPTRTGLLEIARDMGAGVKVDPGGEHAGEPVGDVQAWCEPLRAGSIGGELVPRAIDEIPVACALAARASGTTTISDAAELRVKESDRVATMLHVLRAFGVGCEERPDGLVIEGRSEPLAPVDVTSHGDHRIAMTAAVLGLVASGPSRVRDAACIATSFPKFVGTLRALGARIDVEDG